jgi:uncharacterized protein (DUF2141 family)
MKLQPRWLALCVVALAGTSHAAPAVNEIRVEVTGVRSATGDVRCALFTSEADFLKKPAVKTTAAIDNGKAVCTFAGRPAGGYAVAAFHDENANGKLDTNFVGAPKEGVAVSNNARGKFGPPSFDAARFTHAGASTRMTVSLSY